jgi:hypothetical protein
LIAVTVKPRSGAACASRFQKGLLGFSFLLFFLSVTETENMKNPIATKREMLWLCRFIHRFLNFLHRFFGTKLQTYLIYLMICNLSINFEMLCCVCSVSAFCAWMVSFLFVAFGVISFITKLECWIFTIKYAHRIKLCFHAITKI